MSKYRLKNAELQRHLDAISGGEFTANLTTGDFEFDKDDMAVVTFGSSMHDTKIIAGKFSVILHKNETYVLAEYNPNDWNDFPDVTPPENVLMRVETTTGSKFCGYYHTFAEGGCWCYQDGTVCSEATSKSVERYRPWE